MLLGAIYRRNKSLLSKRHARFEHQRGIKWEGSIPPHSIIIPNFSKKLRACPYLIPNSEFLSVVVMEVADDLVPFSAVTAATLSQYAPDPKL